LKIKTIMSSELAIHQAQSPSLFNIATLIEANDFSLQMSKAKLIPVHLQGSPSDCLRVVMQAAKWGMDPFAVADKTSVISGKLMYEGQLVAAVINTRANLSKRLSYTFSGTGAQRSLVVSGTLRGEIEPLTIDLSYSQACAINKNGQMQKNPDQQMCYIGARIWARRHMPELMLGVTSADEIPEDAEINVTPGVESAPAAEVVPQRQPAPARSKKGAAAVVENKAAIETTATVVPEVASNPAPEPVKAAPAPAPEPAKEPAKPAAPAAAPVAAPAAVPADASAAPRTLKDGEELTATVTVVDVAPIVVKFKDVLTPSVQANVSGQYTGSVLHVGGGIGEGDLATPAAKVTPLPAWKAGATITLKLLGKLNTKSGKVLVRVQEIVEAAADANAEVVD
jgi:hypothetical protein